MFQVAVQKINFSDITALISLIVSIISFFINYFMAPSKNRILKAEDEFVKLLRLLLEKNSIYQKLIVYNGTPADEARIIKEEMLMICELIKLSLKRCGKNKNTSNVILATDNLIKDFNGNNFDKFKNESKLYLNQYK